MAGIGSQTPNWREALAAVDSISHNATYVTSTNGKLDVNASATISGSAIPISGATTAIVTAIVDSSGNQISTFGGGTQYTDAGTPPAHPVGTMPIFNNAGTWSQVSNSAGLPVNIVGGSSSGTQYIQGGATVANPTGTAEIWFDGSGNPKAVTSSQPQPSNLTDGTNTANVVAGDSGFNGVATASATKTYTFTTSATGVQTLLANTNCEGFNTITVVLTSAGSGLTWQSAFAPNTGGTYITGTTTWESAISSGPGVLGNAASIPYISRTVLPFFQLQITAMTGGTTSGYVILSNSTFSYRDPFVGQSGTWTVGSNSATGSAVPGTAFYMAGTSSGTLTGLTIGTNGDGVSATNPLSVSAFGFIYNGSTFDRARTANSASNTTGTGLLGTGPLSVAATALPSAATATNFVENMADKFGRQVVLPNAQRDLVLPMTQLTLTATTTETSLIGAVASTFNDILSLVVINTSATATQVDFRDSTAGTIRLSLYVPAGDTRGISLTTPMPQAAVNTAWTAKCGTSVSSVIITGTYISNK